MTRAAWHPRLTTWVDRVDARWQQLGLTPAARRELRIDLVTDLTQARLDGAPLEELLAVDPDRFATDVAVAQGIEVLATEAAAVPARSGSRPQIRVRPNDAREVLAGRVAIAGLLGSIAGGIGGLVLLFPFMGWAEHHEPDGSAAQVAVLLAIYVGAALVAALCGGLAVATACAPSPSASLLGRRAAVGLIISGAVATVVTVSYANATDYSTETSVVLTEVGLVIGICLIGLILVAKSMGPVPHGVVGRTK